MKWSSVSFTGNEVVKICVQIVLGTVFIVMMKADIRAISEGLTEIKQESKEDRDRQRAWQAKMETEYSEIKVRLAILEQRVNNLEIGGNATH
jgi:hypothetical protein